MKLHSFILLIFVVLTTPLLSQRRSAPGPADYVSMSKRLGENVTWFANDPVILAEGRNRQAVSASAKKHNGLDRLKILQSALAQAKKDQRLVLLYVPRILAGKNGRQAYRPAILDHYMQSVHFSDPDVVNLMNRRFTSLRLTCDNKIGAMLNISAPETLEPAVFFLTHDGKVVEKIDRFRSFNSSWFLSLLLDVLAKNPECSSLSDETQRFEVELVKGKDVGKQYTEALILDGEITYAMQGISDELVRADILASRRVELLISMAHMRRVDGETQGALTSLKKAEKTLNTQDATIGQARKKLLSSALHCERGRTYLLQRELGKAADAFLKVPRGPRRAEAQYHLGICDFFEQRSDMAIRRWKEAAAADPQSPYAWRAADNLIDGPDRTPIGALSHGFEDPFLRPWKSRAAATTATPATIEDTGSIALEATRFLLRMQRANGSWPDSRYAYWGAPDYTPNVWIATTALACMALADWRHLDPEAIDIAIARGEDYMFDRRRIAFKLNEEVYAHAYRLSYLAKKIDLSSSKGVKQRSIDRMNEVINDLQEIQMNAVGKRSHSDGAFAHEYPNAFCTAAVLNALHLAKTRGANVPKRMFIGGAKALQSARDKDGAYAYSNGRKVDTSPATRETRLKDSMGRSPIAEAAMIWSGSKLGSTEKLQAAMSNFWKFMPRLEKVRMCDFHTDGQLAGFFFWHVIYHTTEAINALPSNEQELHRKRLHALLVKLGELDGSFIDSHEIGKSYGTAMALISLKAVMPRKNP